MKVVILAGGQQSTLSEYGEGIPKPMVEIGGKPLLWHIMKQFSECGYSEFIICGGYKVSMIKEYFMDFYIYESDITVNLQNNSIEVHRKKTEDWKVTVVDTGLNTSAGQRIERVKDYIKEDNFIVTYGDCLSDIAIEELVNTHVENNKLATITMAKPTGRNALLPLSKAGELRYSESEQEIGKDAWVDADCFVFKKQIFKYLEQCTDLQNQIFTELSKIKQIGTYPHKGFWMTVETRRDLVQAESLWNTGTAPWSKS